LEQRGASRKSVRSPDLLSAARAVLDEIKGAKRYGTPCVVKSYLPTPGVTNPSVAIPVAPDGPGPIGIAGPVPIAIGRPVPIAVDGPVPIAIDGLDPIPLMPIPPDGLATGEGTGLTTPGVAPPRPSVIAVVGAGAAPPNKGNVGLVGPVAVPPAPPPVLSPYPSVPGFVRPVEIPPDPADELKP
jgi:hypothetical protein